MHFRGRHRHNGRHGIADAVLIVIHKKECLVLFNRPAQAAAELILMIERSRRREEVSGVEVLIPQKLVCGAMKVIAARFRDDVDHCRQRSAVVGRVAVCLDVHFLDRFKRRLDSHPAHDTLFVVHTVNHLSIFVFGHSVHRNGRCLAAVIRTIAADRRGCGSFGCSRGQLENIDDVAADNRNVLHNLHVELRSDV